MRRLIIFLLVLLVVLQVKIWFSSGGVSQTLYLRHELHKQQTLNAHIKAKNKELAAEVSDLRHGNQAVAERARDELGMIEEGEVFYQVVK